jgi:Na+/citrate or Na+/malate symporter
MTSLIVYYNFFRIKRVNSFKIVFKANFSTLSWEKLVVGRMFKLNNITIIYNYIYIILIIINALVLCKTTKQNG